MKILGLDLEGINKDIKEGINLEEDRISEIGAVLWDWNKHQPVKIVNELINEKRDIELTQEITDVTGIDQEMLDEYGLKDGEILQFSKRLISLMESADYIMAHNGGSHTRSDKGYDFQMLEAFFKRLELTMPKTPWIDTLIDLELPKEVLLASRGQKNLTMLATAHEFINPFSHRAVTDVLAMLKIVSRYDLDQMIEYSKSPIVTCVWSSRYPSNNASQEVKDKFNREKDIVSKKYKFRWNAEKKIWTKDVLKIHLDNGEDVIPGDIKITIESKS
ncbi:MAG: 3'-5' exonuclease [Oligoflexia bacterium]|nr:3'-5' exonuclease [Oligoflexia bacterium]